MWVGGGKGWGKWAVFKIWVWIRIHGKHFGSVSGIMMRILWIRIPNTALKTPFLPKHRAKNCLRQKSLRILYCSLIHCIGTLSTVSSANDKNWPTYYNHFWLCKIFKRNNVFRCPQGCMLWTAVHNVTWYGQLSLMLHAMDTGQPISWFFNMNPPTVPNVTCYGHWTGHLITFK